MQALKDAGSLQVEDVASRFDVTTQTIRRDLNELCSLGLAARTHGGARRITTTATIDYTKRREIAVSDKMEIARRTAELVPNGASVSINIGTTTELVASALMYHKDLTVITNNINVVQTLRQTSLKSLIVAGGEVRLSDGAIIGSHAISTFQSAKVDFAIIGASSMDTDGSILDFDQREVAVSRAILAHARNRILVCDNSKFNVSAPHRIGTVDDLDFIVTNTQPPAEFAAVVKQCGATLITTDDPK